MKKCNHYWGYSVWQTMHDSQSSLAVGRYCLFCGKTQTAKVGKWGPLPKSYVGMRDSLRKAFVDWKKT